MHSTSVLFVVVSHTIVQVQKKKEIEKNKGSENTTANIREIHLHIDIMKIINHTSQLYVPFGGLRERLLLLLILLLPPPPPWVAVVPEIFPEEDNNNRSIVSLSESIRRAGREVGMIRVLFVVVDVYVAVAAGERNKTNGGADADIGAGADADILLLLLLLLLSPPDNVDTNTPCLYLSL